MRKTAKTNSQKGNNKRLGVAMIKNTNILKKTLQSFKNISQYDPIGYRFFLQKTLTPKD